MKIEKVLERKCGLCNRTIAFTEQVTFDWANGGIVHLTCYQKHLGMRYVPLTSEGQLKLF